VITIRDSAAEYAAALKAKSEALTARLIAAVNDCTVKLQQRILARPDSPASNAHRRKGWLANSVRAIPAQSDGTTVTGGVEGAGGDAWYGRLFEDGTFRAYPIAAVNTKALKIEMHGEAIFVRRVVHPAFNPMRLAFMRPVVEEMTDEIKAEIEEAALGGLRG
jgi:hypothetical protein